MLGAVAEAARVLRMLENPSTPAPKKRLLMKSSFGDYRKKMSDELRQIDESTLHSSAESESPESAFSAKAGVGVRVLIFKNPE